MSSECRPRWRCGWVFCIGIGTGLVCCYPASSEDWPHWRGLRRNGVAKESSHWDAGAWPPREPAWSVELAAGGSAPIVVDGRLYSLGWIDGKDIVYCLDALSGRELWRQSYECPSYGRYSEGDKALYSGPSASPSYDSKLVSCLRSARMGTFAVGTHDRKALLSGRSTFTTSTKFRSVLWLARGDCEITDTRRRLWCMKIGSLPKSAMTKAT